MNKTRGRLPGKSMDWFSTREGQIQLYALLTEGFCSYRILNTSHGARLFWVVRHEEESNTRCLLILELNEDETQTMRHYIHTRESKQEDASSGLLEPVRRKLHKRRSYLAVMGPAVGLQAMRFRIPRRGNEESFISRLDVCIKEMMP